MVRPRMGFLFTLDVGEIWEPDAVTRHVRIYEGSRVNAARLNIVTPQRETSGKQGKQTLT